MTDLCQPPEDYRGVYGYHWLDGVQAYPEGIPARWLPVSQRWFVDGDWTTVSEATARGWRYSYPAPTPRQMVRMIELAVAVEREACAIIAANECATDIAERIRERGPS